MPRILLTTLVLLLLLIVTAALLVPLVVDEDKLLEIAATALHDQTGATLTVDGDVQFSLLPTLEISLADAAITLPQKQQPNLRAGLLQIGVRLLPLIGGDIEVDSIVLNQIRARIESGAEGNKVDTTALSNEELDAFYAKRRSSLTKSGETIGAALMVPAALRVNRLTINDAQLDFIDPTADAPVRVEIVRLQAQSLNLDGGAIPVEAKVLLVGDQPIELSLNGDIRLDQAQHKVTLEEFKLALIGATADPFELLTSGVIDIERQTADLQLALSSGDMHGKGTVRYAGLKSPSIDSVMHLNLLDPALLLLAGPQAISNKEEDAAGTEEALPLGTLRTIDARTKLSIEQARFDTHTVKDLQANLRVVDGVVQITDVTGVLHEGKLQAAGTFNGKHNTATLTTQGSLTQLDLATALAATDSKPVLGGTATLSWQLNSRGRTTDELTTALQGPIKLTTEDIVLQGTSVEKLLCQIVALTNKEQLEATFSQDTHFDTFTADIQLADGKVTLNPLHAKLTGIALTGMGDFDLLDQEFEATFKARLSPELEQVDHACRVSKRLTAIEWPINCSGRIDTEPGKWCKVDARSILHDLTINEGQEKLEKKAGKLFNKWFNKGD